MAWSGSKTGSTIGAGAGAAAGSFIPGIGTWLGMSIGSFLGGIIGGLFDEGPDVQAYIDEMAKLYADIAPPDFAKAIAYAQYKQGGKLTPQQLSQLPEEVQPAIQLRENPEFRQKQLVQLQQMEQLAQTGMGPQELLALEQSRRAAAADAQARLKSILQQYQQMGQAGGGASLAASLQAAQSADDREAMANMQAAAMAAENRRNAIQQAFSAASGMRQQDLQVAQYNTENLRQKQIFDIQNAMTRQQQNAQYANQANIYNLQRQQQVMDANLQQYNQELYRQQFVAPQLAFQNKMAIANAKAGIIGAKMGVAMQQSAVQSQADMNYMTGLMQMGMGLSQKFPAKTATETPTVPSVPAASTGVQPGFTPGASAANSSSMYQLYPGGPVLPPSGMAGGGFQTGYQQQINMAGMQPLGPSVNMGPSSYQYPWMGPQYSTMPTGMPAPMGVGGNQAGMAWNPVPVNSYSPYGWRT